MKSLRSIGRIVALAIVLALMLSFASCTLFMGKLELKSFTVDRSTVKTSYYIGDEIDFTGIKATAAYTDESLTKVYTFDELTITYADDITATVGTKDVTVSFEDPNLNVTQSATVKITVSVDPNKPQHNSYYINTDDVKKEYVLGEELELSGIKLFEKFNIGNDVEITDKTDLVFEGAENATATAGAKTIIVKYNGETAGSISIIVTDPASTKNTITSIVIGGSFDSSYETGDTVDFTGLAITVTYKDGTVETVTDGITYSDVDTNTAGTKTVIASFLDPINEESASQSFTITVIKAKATVMGFEKPLSIINFETLNKNAGTIEYVEGVYNGFSGQFSKGGQVYVIGDDNEFRLVPQFEIRENGVSSYPTSFYMDVAIYIKDGDNYAALSAVKDTQRPTSVSFYNGDVLIAAVDTYLGRYQFSEAAVGNTFKIAVLPSSEHYNLNNANTMTLEAKIIDAYNVYEAWQISVIDNYQTDLWKEIKIAHGIDGYSPAGIVLHNDISITADDVPSEMFYTTTEEITYTNSNEETITVPVGTKYLKDGWDVYRRTGDKDFTIQGNFFNLDSDKFPLVPSPAVFGDAYSDRHYGSDFSNSSLFMFETLSESFKAKPDKVSNVLIENLAIIGNAATNSIVDSEGNLVSAGGLIFLKSSRHTVTTMNNIVGNSFFITYFPEYAGTLNLNDVKCYDSYQNAIYIWSDGIMNIKDSYFVHAGGPLAICNSVEENGVWYNPVLNAENTVTYTALSGEEIWFSAVNANAIVGQIKALGAGLGNAGLGNFVGENGKMNIVGLLMKSGTNPTEIIGGVQAQGSVWLDDKGIDRLMTDEHWVKILTHAATNMSQGKIYAYLTVYDQEGNAYTVYANDGGQMFDLNDQVFNPQGNLEHATIAGLMMQSESIVLTQGGLSIIFEFYH